MEQEDSSLLNRTSFGDEILRNKIPFHIKNNNLNSSLKCTS